MELKRHLLGHFEPNQHPDFREIPAQYCDEPGHYLQKQALEAWIELANAAQRDGFSLVVISSTRNFERQKRIWENKWNGRTLTNGENLEALGLSAMERAERILKYSAMPGTSRHHWGTDLDFNSVENAYFEQGEGREIYQWMREHAAKFGFHQPYTAKGPARKFGYEEEPWHWSFSGQSINLLENYLAEVGYADLLGFDGFETAGTLEVIEKYVKGIAPDCLPGAKMTEIG